MSNPFRTIQDVLEASRRGDSLYEIYRYLQQSDVLLKEHQKNAFTLLSEMLLLSLNEEIAQEIVTKFYVDPLNIYVTTISPSIAQIFSKFKGTGLFLNKEKELDEETAKMLAQWKGS
ncbi:MAG: hypothetical protein AABZ60_14355, partial [Planctomycetota bacterium]